jgi:prevent-host-death family protein
MAITEARDQLAEVVNEVRYSKKRIVLKRHGKGLVAMVPVEDLELLEQLEDAYDLSVVRERLTGLNLRRDTISLEELKKRLHK